MYAVKGGHIDTVKVLMECEFLKYDLKNKVCAQPYPPTSLSLPPPPPPPPLQLTCAILSYNLFCRISRMSIMLLPRRISLIV